MNYPSYPEYKNTKVKWLEKIPSNWHTKKLKYIANCYPSNVDKKSKEGEVPVLLCNYTDVYYNEVITSAISFMKATATQDQFKKFKLQKNDIIITKDSEDPNDIAIPSIIKEEIDQLVCGYHLTMIRTKNQSALYYKKVLDSQFARCSFAIRANGLTRYGISTYSINNIEFPFPPLSEQKAIAAFLDRETAKIDKIIAKQQKLIELLQEKRQAVISHAVTKGLDPNVKMKDSGVEWLGEIPEHWKIVKVKHVIIKFEQGWSPQCHSEPAEKEEYGVLKVGCVNNSFFKSYENKALPKNLKPKLRYTLNKGDLLISRANTKELVGSAAVVDNDYKKLILCDKLYRIRFSKLANSQFVSYYLASSPVRRQIELEATGASHSMQNIGQATIKELRIPLPPLTEVAGLVLDIKKITNKLDLVIKKVTKQIELLKEKRTALISAAVTGKIDVRNKVTPEEIESNQND
ncbi:restriction endonuclease subunit S [Candidatus Uabimicrobium sp. HlEnr_7]|uniref:restriction endonuclease subunit S n=1 Tax=Candidatus Uabimicrobium helgolandensis TaxID=3095367 RepID=UPI003558640D